MLKVLLRRGVALGAFETLYTGERPANCIDDSLYHFKLRICHI